MGNDDLAREREIEILQLEIEIAEAEKRKAQSMHQGAPAAPGGNREAYYANQVKKGTSGGWSLPGMLVDAANAALGGGEYLLREISGSNITDRIAGTETPQTFPAENPLGGTRNLMETFNKWQGVQDIEAPTKLDEVAGLGIEMGIPSIPFMGRNVMQAPHKWPAYIAEGASLIGSSVGGVVGEDLGRELGESEFGERLGVTPEGGAQTGKMIGIAGGGTAPAVAPAIVSNIGGRVIPSFTNAGRKSAAQREAGRILKPALESELHVGENIRHADEVAQEMKKYGDFEPTIAGRTGAGVVEELEESIAESTPATLGRYSLRKDVNQATLDKATDELLGTKTAGGGRRRSEGLPRQASSRLIHSRKLLSAKLDQLEKQSKTLAEKVEGFTQEPGVGLRDQYWKNRTAVRDEFKKGYNDLYDVADQAGVKVDMSAVDDIAQDIAKADQNVYQDMPTTFGKLRRRTGGKKPFDQPVSEVESATNALALIKETGEGAERSFREFHSLWKEVNREYGKALRANDTQKMEYLKQLKTPLDQQIKQMEGGTLGELSDNFAALNKDYSTRYAKTFKEGIGGRVADVGRFGATMDDANVVNKFFTPDGIDDFFAVYGDDANAQQLLKDGVLGMYAKKAIDEVTRKIKPGASESFLRTNAETLKKVPEIDALLRNTDEVNRAVMDRSVRLRNAQADMDASVLKKVSKNEDVNKLITDSASSPRKMRELFALAKNNDQRKAIARTFADNLPVIAAKAKMDPYKYLLANEQTLKPLIGRLGENHWENLKIISGAQTLQGRMRVPGRVNVPRPKDELFEVTGSNARSIVSTYLSVLRKRTSPHGEASQFLARFGIKRKGDFVDEIMAEAIYDPEMADALVAEMKGGKTKYLSNKLSNNIETAVMRALIAEKGDKAEVISPELSALEDISRGEVISPDAQTLSDDKIFRAPHRTSSGKIGGIPAVR